MVLYQYRCQACGVFEVALPMGRAGATHPCVSCDADARRAYTAPHLSRTSKPLADALTRAEKSQDEPEVVNAPPPRPRRPNPQLPEHLRRQLPRW